MAEIFLLILVRGLHFLSVSALFGAALFPRYAVEKSMGLPPRVARQLSGLMKWSALLALISGLLWFALVMAQAGPASPSRLAPIWMVRLVLAATLTYLLASKRWPHAQSFVLITSAVLLVSLAGSGHDGSRNAAGASAHFFADLIHLLASGVWLGALFVLMLSLIHADRQGLAEEARFMHHALMRFSDYGPAVVIALAMSGLAKGGLVGPQNAVQTLANTYSQVLVAKIGLFILMLILAAANRYWLTPMLKTEMTSSAGTRTSIRALRTSLVAESALAILVMAAVGVLGVLPLPGTK